MSDAGAPEMLAKLIALTRDDEIDCEAFHAHVAALVEGNVHDPKLRALLDHHRAVCPECEEERIILARALGLDA